VTGDPHRPEAGEIDPAGLFAHIHLVEVDVRAGPDEHGYFSLGMNADYVASMIGEVPFFLEVSDAVPFTYGQNLVHTSQVAGWISGATERSTLPKRL